MFNVLIKCPNILIRSPLAFTDHRFCDSLLFIIDCIFKY